LRLINVDTRWVVSLKPRVLEQTNIGGKHRLFCITNTLAMDTSGIGLTEIAHQTLFPITNEIVFHRMPFFYHYTGPFARWDLWDDGLVFPCHQSENPLQHKGRGRVQGFADLARVNIVPLQERSLRSA